MPYEPLLELSGSRNGDVAMRKIAIWSCAAVLLAVAGVAIAGARAGGWNRCPGNRWCHFGAMGYLAHELSLRPTQKQQIRSMWQAERPTISGLLQEFAAESKEMDQATAKGNLDVSKVQEIATRQGATVAKLSVEKEHFKAKIYTTVLDPEQRAKADALQSRLHERFDHISRAME
jgi:Spy/CpxP family protein refolding chaperone